MNILPKKSWHVLNKDNLERVRKDEEKARKEDEDKQYRAQMAEKQRRIALLRQRTKQKNGQQPSAAASSPSTASSGHVNLFEEEERQRMEARRNEDYEAEKKKDREKLDRQITMYIEREKQPWYANGTASSALQTEDSEKKRKRDDQRKDRQDPLRKVQRSLQADKTVRTTSAAPTSQHKSTYPPQLKTKKTIEEMRQERLEREQEERKRARLVQGLRPEPDANSEKGTRKRYENQFNPTLARQNQGRGG